MCGLCRGKKEIVCRKEGRSVKEREEGCVGKKKEGNEEDTRPIKRKNKMKTVI